MQKSLKRKSTRRRLIRYSLVTANVLVLAGVVGFIAVGSHGGQPVMASAVASSDTAAANPVDGLTSYDIAANVANMTDLPESTAIDNQAQSAKAALAVSSGSGDVVVKPQIVATALKSRDDIHNYMTIAGDTVTSVAQKFGVTTDSIRWSNGLSSNAVATGTKLVIPPVNGIVYTVKAGDTVQGLATKYKANADQIVAYNDAEIAGITPGEQIIIPNGQIQVVVNTYGGSYGGSFTPLYSSAAGGSCARYVAQYPCLYGSNGYDFGWCTWYVASRIAMPSNWGNANTWAYFAARSGWTVSKIPKAGAIVQSAGGNHVGYVEQVSDDGSQILYSDMNGLAGWGRVGHSGWVSAADGFDGGKVDTVYIYR